MIHYFATFAFWEKELSSGQDSGQRRFALVDSVLDNLPRVCEVGVFDGKSINYFYIFFSRGRNIRVNRPVKTLSNRFSWTGDILIPLRGSARSQGVVNMRGQDAKLADFAIKKYVFWSQFGLVLSNTIQINQFRIVRGQYSGWACFQKILKITDSQII
jgi:hypothetical protein